MNEENPIVNLGSEACKPTGWHMCWSLVSYRACPGGMPSGDNSNMCMYVEDEISERSKSTVDVQLIEDQPVSTGGL